MADNALQTTGEGEGHLADVADSDSGIGSESSCSTPSQSVGSTPDQSVAGTPSGSEMSTPVLSPAVPDSTASFVFPPGAFGHQQDATTGREKQQSAMDVDFTQLIRPATATATATPTPTPTKTTATTTTFPQMDRSGFFVQPDPPRPQMQIFVRNFNGQLQQFQINQDASVTDLKKMIHNKMGVPPSQQRLVYQGKEFTDGTRLEFYGVQSLSEINLLGRLRGGRGDRG
ncbi:hypothetical protein EGW08_005353 [Elysia chlorotica]|uniref:Ubiquitin-like domain-containing protein n=1 Tax=Elysia chlorotica TaxID=188477 RepID=A0A433TZ76_ELYCH|nr:hypothetical protein EGW08_005353 [Elysia chlorotica]